MNKRINVHHYAVFREARGCPDEAVTTRACTPRELYEELGLTGTLTLTPGSLRVAVNDAFASWNAPLHDGDLVVFIAPTAGG